MELQTLRNGIATALATIDGLRVVSYIPDSGNPPLAFPGLPDTWGYHKSFGRNEGDCPNIPVYVVTGIGSDMRSQELLSAYVSPTGDQSVVEALATDRTLSGSCADHFVRECAFIRFTLGGQEMLAAKFSVRFLG